jgi:hypothetical protein
MIFIWEIYWPGKVIVKIACCDLFSLPANSTRRRIVKVLHNKFINIHLIPISKVTKLDWSFRQLSKVDLN